jgi:hypothetical protein
MKSILPIGLLLATTSLVYAYRKEISNAMDHPQVRRLVNPGPLSAGHGDLEGRCESCHTANGGVRADRCIVCHANNQRLLQRQPTAFHATIGECATCHFEHIGKQQRPIRMDHSLLASAGARTQRSAPPASSVFAPFIENAKPTSPEATLRCATCHAIEDKHVGLFGQECSACHSVASWKVPGYRHPPESSLDCAQCHQAPPSHYMEHFHMVSEKVAGVEHANVKQCYLCHQTTVWNDIRGVGYYKHH